MIFGGKSLKGVVYCKCDQDFIFSMCDICPNLHCQALKVFQKNNPKRTHIFHCFLQYSLNSEVEQNGDKFLETFVVARTKYGSCFF